MSDITVVIEQNEILAIEVPVAPAPKTIQLNQGNTGPAGPAGPPYDVAGSWTSPLSITAAGGISANAEMRQLQFVQGSGGPIDISKNPQIQPPGAVGMELTLIGCSDVNTLKLEDGNGIKMNGFKTLKQGSVIRFIAVTTSLWLEDSRTWT